MQNNMLKAGIIASIATLTLLSNHASAAAADLTSRVQTQISIDSAQSPASGFFDLGGGKERTYVAKGARTKGGCCLDPRVERYYPHIPAWDDGDDRSVASTTDYQWKGSYKINTARNTTVFQLLNNDPLDPDRERPTLFLEVDKIKDSQGRQFTRMCDGKCNEGAPVLFTQYDDDTFHLRVRVIDGGRRAKVYVDGALKYEKTLDRYENTTFQDVGLRTRVRYGAYHHNTKVVTLSDGSKTKEAVGNGDIEISNIEYRRLN